MKRFLKNNRYESFITLHYNCLNFSYLFNDKLKEQCVCVCISNSQVANPPVLQQLLDSLLHAIMFLQAEQRHMCIFKPTPSKLMLPELKMMRKKSSYDDDDVREEHLAGRGVGVGGGEEGGGGTDCLRLVYGVYRQQH